MFEQKFAKIGILVTAHLVASIALIQIELYLSDIYEFPNMILEAIFQLCIFIGLVVMWRLGAVFDLVLMPIFDILQVSAAYFFMFTFDCLSYDYNARGTYELMKALNLPLVFFITVFFYRQNYHTKIKLTFLPILVGISIVTMTDLTFNIFGFLYGTASSISASIYLVLVQEKIKKFSLSPLQLMVYQAPIAAAMLGIYTPFYDTMNTISLVFEADKNFNEWLFLILVGVAMFCINYCVIGIVRLTSSLSFNVYWVMEFLFMIQFPMLFGPLYLRATPGFEFHIGIGLLVFGLYMYYRYNQHDDETSNLPPVKLTPLKFNEIFCF